MSARQEALSGTRKDRGRASYLGPHEMFLLDNACKPIAEAFNSHPYLVGSVMETGQFRDVDVRLILEDIEYARLAAGISVPLVNIALTAYLRRMTGLPVDFQIQQQTAANELHPGAVSRNPLGARPLIHFLGDGAPINPDDEP